MYGGGNASGAAISAGGAGGALALTGANAIWPVAIAALTLTVGVLLLVRQRYLAKHAGDHQL